MGFLGAAPPAVKGLADLKFNDDEPSVTFDFYDPQMGTIARIFRGLRDWLIEKEGKDVADSIIPDWDVEFIKEESNKPKPETGSEPGFTDKEEGMKNFKEKVKSLFSSLGVDVSKIPDDAIPDSVPEGITAGSFTEADIEAAKKEERKKADAEFAEKQRKAAKAARDKDIADFVAQQVKDGKLLPAWVDSGLVAFAQGLDGDETVQFAEGDEGKKTQLDWFKNFLEGFGKSPIFKEMATKESAGDSAEFAEAKKQEELGNSIAAKVNG